MLSSVPEEVIELLQRHKTEQTRRKLKLGSNWTETGFCFTTETGQMRNPDAPTRWLKRFGKKIGIPNLHPHGFRHTQASVLIANGTDPVAVSTRLGHAQVSTTMNIYAHAFAKADERVTDTIADVFYHHTNPDDKKQA